ncbi:hypothetical protein [Snodgrassella alvi]|uniref:hypothetical protein n=1 Tax=Snodgrassella alvi TaxID=1196083 RepID=UPI000C1EAAAC|nr:hypothetical protein [Snodgrassella alvi]PIT45908.1 hypothetical protein BHC51_08060 [Snodgrassella alvi]
MSLNNATDWQFPVGDKQYSLSKLFTALAEAQSGYYLLGKNQQWHGGIHVDAQVLNQLQLTDKVAVKCMAEGEVVAYRLNDNYLRLEKPDKKVAFYSSGFTLIRHLLQMDYVAPSYSINDKFEVVSGQDSLTHGVHIRRRPRGEYVGYLMNGANITLDIDYQYQSDNGYYWYPLLAINNGYSSIPKLTPIPLPAPPTELAAVGPVASCLGWLSLGRYPLTHNQQIILGQRDKASENQAVM